jgi:hypothetical protein
MNIKELVNALLLAGVISISGQYASAQTASEPPKAEAKAEAAVSFEQRVSDAKSKIEEGKPGAYFTIEECLKNKAKLPELTIEDLRKITMYPRLTFEPDSLSFKPVAKVKGASLKSNSYLSAGNAYPVYVIEGDTFNIQLSTMNYIDFGATIKHSTNEAVDGIKFPKDLIFLQLRRAETKVAELDSMKKNQMFLKSHNFPRLDAQIIGKIKQGEEEYIVLDSYLFSKEMYESSPGAIPGAEANYNAFISGRIDLTREYFNLRGKTEEEIKSFSSKTGKLLETKVQIAGRKFSYMHYKEETGKQITDLVKKIESETSKTTDAKLFSDYLAQGNADPIAKKLGTDSADSLGGIIAVLDTFFKKKLANNQDIDGWETPLEKLIDYKKFDCDTGTKIAVNAFRSRGFAANFALTYTKPMKKDSNWEWHAWTEVYVPQENTIVVFDVNNPDRNYIFKADSKEKMDYVFDYYVAKKSKIVMQMNLNGAFDLK